MPLKISLKKGHVYQVIKTSLRWSSSNSSEVSPPLPFQDRSLKYERSSSHYRERKAGHRGGFRREDDTIKELPSPVHIVYPQTALPANIPAMMRLDAQTEDFNTLKQVTIQHLMNAGVHLGHSTSRWNPRMAPYIFGTRDGIHIIDLNQTVVLLRRSLSVTREIARRNGIILFVCANPKTDQIREAILEDALRCEQYPMVHYWLPGLLTNSYQVLGTDEFIPDLVLFFDINHHQEIGVNETTRKAIPTIAICDTDCDPSRVTYVVPGNNDSAASICLFSRLFSNAALEGRKQGFAQGLISTQPTNLKRPRLPFK
jgi:ribosomal protein S2